jgi:hypothetical protein
LPEVAPPLVSWAELEAELSFQEAVAKWQLRKEATAVAKGMIESMVKNVVIGLDKVENEEEEEEEDKEQDQGGSD